MLHIHYTRTNALLKKSFSDSVERLKSALMRVEIGFF